MSSRRARQPPAHARPARAGAARRRPRARARQGHRHRRRHPGQPARHRAAHDQAPAPRRLGGQGEGDGHRLVGGRPVPQAGGTNGNELEDRLARARAGGRARAADATRSDRVERRGQRPGTSTASCRRRRPGALADATASSRAVELVTERRAARRSSSASPLDEFGEEPLRRNLERRDWLEAARRAPTTACSSGRSASTPLVPLRFGTVYRSEDGVRAMLARARRPSSATALERLRGRVELGVKAFLDSTRGRARRPRIRDAPVERQGAAYLARASSERARFDAARSGRARAASARCTSTSPSLADDARANPPQPPELSGRGEAMLLNGAYLVADGDAAEFEVARSTSTRDDRLELVLTGPWPPYNFVEREEPS